MIYYVDGKFASRKAIEVGSVTLHPSAIPHGPAPGLAEKSIGMTETHELAVMCDTFHPLRLTSSQRSSTTATTGTRGSRIPAPVGSRTRIPPASLATFDRRAPRAPRALWDYAGSFRPPSCRWTRRAGVASIRASDDAWLSTASSSAGQSRRLSRLRSSTAPGDPGRVVYRRGPDEAPVRGARVPSVARSRHSSGAAVDERMRFKATAGLHHALPTGGEHGFLNLLAACVFGDEEAMLATREISLDAKSFRADGGQRRRRRRARAYAGSCSLRSARARSRSPSESCARSGSCEARRLHPKELVAQGRTRVGRVEGDVVVDLGEGTRCSPRDCPSATARRCRLRRPVAAAVSRRGLRRLLLVARARDEHGAHVPAGLGAADAELAAPADRLPRARRNPRRQRDRDPAAARPAQGRRLRPVAEARHRARARLRDRQAVASRRACARRASARPRLRRGARQRLERARHPGVRVRAARAVPRQVVRDVDLAVRHDARRARRAYPGTSRTRSRSSTSAPTTSPTTSRSRSS